MSKAIVRHKVKDYAAWRPYFDADLGNQTAAGLTNPQVYRSESDKGELVLVWDAADVAKAKAFFASPSLKATMIEAGVMDTPSVYFPA
jgi:hypothetical protein